jgi:hypothetical protein
VRNSEATVEQQQAEFLSRVLRGNSTAVEFCLLLGQITQVWDDLVDGDNPALRKADIDAAFWNLFVALPRNEFYREHFDTLNPLLQAAIVDWWDANELQRDPSPQNKAVAYVLRDTLTTVVIHCARLVGGYDWMRQVSMDVRRFLYTEDLEHFIREHSNG